MKKILRILIALSSIVLLLSACVQPPGGADSQLPGVRSWFDAPLPNTVFYPPNPCQIVAHGASPKGIALFEISVNGNVVNSIPSPDAQSSLVTLTQDCGLSEVGEYQILMRAQDNAGNWSGYTETFIIISDITNAEDDLISDFPIVTLVLDSPSPTETATNTPSPLPTSTPEKLSEVTIESVTINLIYVGGKNCGENEVRITAHAIVPDGIKVVIIFYRFQTGNSSGDFLSKAMNPLGGDLYQAVLNPGSELEGAVPFDQALLQYQIVVQKNDGDTSVRTELMSDITMLACGNTSAVCSSYTDKRTCIANGCKWVAGLGMVPVYTCETP